MLPSVQRRNAHARGKDFFLPNRWACKSFYTQHGMPWYYDDLGKWCGPVRYQELWMPG